MKINTHYKILAKAIFYIMFFNLSIQTALAQCPVVNDTSPIICDAAGFTFNDLNSFATDSGNGIVWFDAPSGGSAFNSNELVVEGTYYADDNSGSCGTRASILVTFQIGPSGQNLDGIYCSNDNATIQTYIDEVLVPNIPSGGSVQVFTDFNLTTLANSTDNIPLGVTGFFITFVDSLGCRSPIVFGSTAVFDSPDEPTPPNPQEFCSIDNPTIADLNPGTTGDFSWFDNIDGLGNPIPPALSLTTPLVDGETYYVQATNTICTSEAVAVTVIIGEPVDAGIPGVLEFCNDSVPTDDFNLFDELGGTPDATGTWSGPLTTTNGFLGTVNISSLTTPGVFTFTYTVTSSNNCPDETSTVTITIFEPLSSGTPSAENPATFCEMDLPSAFDLFSLLDNEDAGGVWTQDGTVVTSPIDLTGFGPGTIDFTYTQNTLPNPCPEESTTVQVIILEDPNAGNAINAIFCENDLIANSPFDLFTALDGTQDNNDGVWTDVNGGVVSNSIDISGFTVANSPFQFTYTIDNGSCMDSETITITVDPAPESGTINSSPEFCIGEGSANFDLFDLLDGEDQTGTWFIGTDTSGTVTSNIIDLSVLPVGTFNFTYDVAAIGSCDDELITVTIIINPLPNAGTPTPLEFCENELVANSPIDLFDQLTDEDLGGTWADDNNSGALSGSIVDLTQLSIGVFNFTYSITNTNGCTDNSTVTITITDAPESGTINSTPEFCIVDITTGQTLDLFDLLDDEDQTGTWSDDTPSGALSGSIVTLDGLPEGSFDFTYDVAAIGSCDDDLVTVTIIINDTPAPNVPTSQEFCDTSATVGDLSPSSGVQWYEDVTGGNPLDNATTLIDGENYFATQTDASTGCESSNRTEVTVTVFISPNSGNPIADSILACNGNNIIDLNTALDGTQDLGGIWMDDDGTGTLTGSIFNASTLPEDSYNFTYFVAASGSCLDASTQVTVVVSNSLPPDVVNATPVFCAIDEPTITNLNTTISATGTITWYDDMFLSNILDPSEALINGEDYFATQTNDEGCESLISSSVLVTIGDAPTPTLLDPNFGLCINDSPTLNDLSSNIAQFDITLGNVVWYDAEIGGTVLDNNTLLALNTAYYAALVDSATGCESSVRLGVTPDLTACGVLVLPDGFSPNSDGVNDTFDADNLGVLFPNFDIEIFNRNGNVVYRGNNSTPRFDGTSNQSGTLGNGNLPVGVYFYIFRFNDGENSPMQGRLYLSR